MRGWRRSMRTEVSVEAEREHAKFAWADPDQLEAVLGGRVHQLIRSEGGASRWFWTFELERDGRMEPMVMLGDTGRGPWSNTAFDMAREASILRAVGEMGLPVARVHFVSPGHDLLIMDRLPAAPPSSSRTLRFGRLRSNPSRLCWPGSTRSIRARSRYRGRRNQPCWLGRWPI